MDQIQIKDLLLRGLVGINPDEQEKEQDILINLTLYTDLTVPAQTDRIEDALNYRTLTKQIIRLVEENRFLLVEKLAADIAGLCLATERVTRAVVTVEKPGALRFARSVGVTLDRRREEGR